MKHAWNLILGVLLALSAISCRESLNPDGPNINLTIEFPGTASFAGKGEAGSLPASDLENTIHTLSVWVFRSDTHEIVTYLPLEEDDFPYKGGVRRYSLPVTREFAATKPDIDIFVLANVSAIYRSTLNRYTPWAELNELSFGNRNYDPYYDFGIDSPVHAVDPAYGLPMSACVKNQHLQGEEPIFQVPTLRLSRAVSRLRYVFCKTRSEGDGQDEVSINRIILNGKQIPLKEYVFTTGSTGIVMEDTEEPRNNYIDSEYIVTWPAATEIAENATPEDLIYVNQDPQTYQQVLDDAIEAGELTDLGFTYLRESDRRLVGKIEYTINGKNRTREFNMVSEGDFARNHTWTVFGYFLGGRNLQLSINVLPWDYNSFNVNFSEMSVSVADKFKVDEGSVDLTETSKDHFDAHLLPGIAAKGHIYVTTPVGGNLMIRPIGDAYAFQVTPDIAVIDPTINSGRIDISIRRNPDRADEDLTGKAITLSFAVEIGDREIDANTEAVDQVYRFIL